MGQLAPLSAAYIVAYTNRNKKEEMQVKEKPDYGKPSHRESSPMSPQ